MTSRQVIATQKSQYFIHHQAFGVVCLPWQGEALPLSARVSSCTNLAGLCAVIHVTALAQKTSKHFTVVPVMKFLALQTKWKKKRFLSIKHSKRERLQEGKPCYQFSFFQDVLLALDTTKGWGIFYKCNLGTGVILCPRFPSLEIKNINVWEDVGIHEQQAANSAGEEQWRGNPACAHNGLRTANGVDQHRVCDSEKLQSHPDRGAHWFKRLRRGNPYW